MFVCFCLRVVVECCVVCVGDELREREREERKRVGFACLTTTRCCCCGCAGGSRRSSVCASAHLLAMLDRNSRGNTTIQDSNGLRRASTPFGLTNQLDSRYATQLLPSSLSPSLHFKTLKQRSTHTHACFHLSDWPLPRAHALLTLQLQPSMSEARHSLLLSTFDDLAAAAAAATRLNVRHSKSSHRTGACMRRVLPSPRLRRRSCHAPRAARMAPLTPTKR